MVKLSQGEHHGVKLAYNLAAAWCHHGQRRQLIWGCQGDQSEFCRCCCTKISLQLLFFKISQIQIILSMQQHDQSQSGAMHYSWYT